MGTVVAFAVAELAFGYLNSSTAFLGSIIIGNGINYAIVLMSRYEEHRARGEATGDALRGALGGTWRGTLVAAFAASAAYASLMVTSFRGFYQFGVMGAAGALVCWIATYTVLPAMLILLDRRQSPAAAPQGPRAAGARLAGPVPAAARGADLVVFAVLSVVSVVGMQHFLKAPFEYDFRKLNAKLSTTAEAQQFDRNQDKLFGRWPSPTIVLADQVERRRADQGGDPPPGQGVAGRRRHRPDRDHLRLCCQGRPRCSSGSSRCMAQIRKLTHDPALEVLTTQERADLAEIDPPADLRELPPMDLPAWRAGRSPRRTAPSGGWCWSTAREGFSVWNGRDLLRIARCCRTSSSPTDGCSRPPGRAVVFSSMIRSVLRDGPMATVLAAGGAAHHRAHHAPGAAALMAMASLMVGVLWMVGGAGWAKVEVTFLNFIALPITFGIGGVRAQRRLRYREDAT